MSLLFLEYPACSTCRKAKAWLDNNKIQYTDRHIKEQNPTASELQTWHKKSGLPLKKFFNTSGMVYKEMKLKDKLPAMSEEEDEFTKNEEIMNLRMQRSLRLKQNIGDFVDQNPQIAAKLVQSWLRGEEVDGDGGRSKRSGSK